MADDFDEDINRDWFLEDDEFPKASPSHMLDGAQDDPFNQSAFNQSGASQGTHQTSGGVHDFDLVVPVEGECGSVSVQSQKFTQSGQVIYQQSQGYEEKQDGIIHQSQPSTSNQQTYEINGVQYVQQPVSSQPQQQFAGQEQGQYYTQQGQYDQQWDQSGQQFQIQYVDDQSNQGEPVRQQQGQQFVNVNNVRISQGQGQQQIQQLQIPAGQVAQQLLMPDGKVVLVLTQQNQDPQQTTGQYIQQQIATSNAQNMSGQNLVMVKNGQQPLRIVQQNQPQQQVVQGVEMDQQGGTQSKPETPTKKGKSKKPSKKQLAQMAAQQQPQFQQPTSQTVQVTQQGHVVQSQYQPQQMVVMSQPPMPVSPAKNRRPGQRTPQGQIVQVNQAGQPMQRQVVVTQSGQQIISQPSQQVHMSSQPFNGQVVQVGPNGQPIQIQQQIVGQQMMQQQVQQIIVPTKDDIMQKMMSLTSVRFSTPEQSAEFGSVMTEIVSLPDNAPPEKLIEVSNRLDALIAQAEKETSDSKTQQKPVKEKPKPARKPKPQPKPVVQQPVQQQYIHQAGPSTSQGQVIQRPAGIQRQEISYQNQQPYPQQVQQPPPIQVPPQNAPKKSRPKKLTKKQQQELERQQQLQQHDSQGRPVYVVQTGQGPVYTQNGQQIVFQYHPGQPTSNMGSLQPQPPPIRVPTPIVLPSPKELAAMIRKKQEQRKNRLAYFFNTIKEDLNHTDYITPFKDMTDVYNRLLPFSLVDEPELSKEHLEKVDHEMLRHKVYMEAGLKRVEDKMRSIFFKDAMTDNQHKSEVNMLLFLDAEYERRRFEADKKEAKDDLEAFLRESEIVRFGSDVEEVQEKMRSLQTDKVDMPHGNTYEYHEFDEEFYFREIPRTPTPPAERKKHEKRPKKPQFGYLYESDEDEDEEEESESEEDEPRQQTVQSSSDESEEADVPPDFEQPRAPINVQTADDEEEDLQFVRERKSKSSEVEIIGEQEPLKNEGHPNFFPAAPQMLDNQFNPQQIKPDYNSSSLPPPPLRQPQTAPITIHPQTIPNAAQLSQLERRQQADREQMAHVQREIEEMKQMESQFAQSQAIQESPNYAYQHSHQSNHPLSNPSIHAPTPPSRPQIQTPGSHPHVNMTTPPSRQNLMMNTPPGSSSMTGYPGSVGKPGSAQPNFPGSVGHPQMARPGSVGQMGPPSVHQHLNIPTMPMPNQPMTMPTSQLPMFGHGMPGFVPHPPGVASQMTHRPQTANQVPSRRSEGETIGPKSSGSHNPSQLLPSSTSSGMTNMAMAKPSITQGQMAQNPRLPNRSEFPYIPDDLANIEPFYAANGPIMPDQNGFDPRRAQHQQSLAMRQPDQENRRLEQKSLDLERQKREDEERRNVHSQFLKRQLEQQQEKLRRETEKKVPAPLKNPLELKGSLQPNNGAEMGQMNKNEANSLADSWQFIQQIQKEQLSLVEQHQEDAKRHEETRKALAEQKRRDQANDKARLHLENVQKQRLQNVNPMAGLLNQQKELLHGMEASAIGAQKQKQPPVNAFQAQMVKEMAKQGAVPKNLLPTKRPDLLQTKQRSIDQPLDLTGPNLNAEMQRNLKNMNQEMNMTFGEELGNQTLVNFFQSMNKSQINEFQTNFLKNVSDAAKPNVGSLGQFGEAQRLQNFNEPHKRPKEQPQPIPQRPADVVGQTLNQPLPGPSQNPFASLQRSLQAQNQPQKDVRLGQTSIKGLKFVPQSQALSRQKSQEDKPRPPPSSTYQWEPHKPSQRDLPPPQQAVPRTVDPALLKNLPKPMQRPDQAKPDFPINSRLKTAMDNMQRANQSKEKPSNGLVGRQMGMNLMNPVEKVQFGAGMGGQSLNRPLTNKETSKKGTLEESADTSSMSSNAQMPLKWRMKRELNVTPVVPAQQPLKPLPVQPVEQPLPSLKLKIAIPKKSDEDAERKERKKQKKEEKKRQKEEKKKNKKSSSAVEKVDQPSFGQQKSEFPVEDQPGPSNWNGNGIGHPTDTPSLGQPNGKLKLKIRLGPKPEEPQKPPETMLTSVNKAPSAVEMKPVDQKQPQEEDRPLKMKIRLPKPEPMPIFEPEEEGPPMLEAQKVPKLTLRLPKAEAGQEEEDEEPKKKKKKHKKHKRHRSKSPSDENERPEKIPRIKIKALAPPQTDQVNQAATTAPSTSQNPFAVDTSTPQFSDVEDYSDDERLCHLSSKLLTKLK